MTGPVDVGYLDGMYESGDDPWGIGPSWYERRKRELVLAALVLPRYRSVFEPGCAAGELTAGLAPRSQQLLAADLSARAVAAAGSRFSDQPQVQVQQLLLPDEWPAQPRFDLVVLSEIGYFFTEPAWVQLCERVAGSLLPDATVLACHWRHDFEQRTLDTDWLHAQLAGSLGIPRQSKLIDADFVLEVWCSSSGSLAEREGLVAGSAS